MYTTALQEQMAAFVSSLPARAVYVQGGNEYNAAITKQDSVGTTVRIWIQIPANTNGISKIRVYDEDDILLIDRIATIQQSPGRPTLYRIETTISEVLS